MGLFSIVLFIEHSPPLYHAYFAMTIFLWTQILGEYQFIKALLRYISRKKSKFVLKVLAIIAVSVILLELLVRPQNTLKISTHCQ